MFYPLLISSIAGISTAIGAVIIICSKNITDNQMGLSQGFAAGVMLAVSVLDILPESYENYFVYINEFNAAKAVGVLFVAGVIMGWAVCGVALPDTAVDRSDKTASAKRMALVTTAVMVFHNMPEGVLTFFSAAKDLTMGAKMALAVALHNVPEGMTSGASYASNNGVMGSSALVLASLIGLHNIPEGMAVSVPLISGGMGKAKAIFMTALSGVPTILGALLGYAIGDIGPMGLALSLGFASGAMLYVVFGEMLPQAILMYHSKLPAFSAIAGILVGLLVIYV